jgi:hypothetical protein
VALVLLTVAAPHVIAMLRRSRRLECMWTAPSAPEAQPRAFRVSVTERHHGETVGFSGCTQNRPAKYLAGLLLCGALNQLAHTAYTV